MDKIDISLSLDRNKALDEAIFMLIEARRKCYEGFGPTASDRIDIAIRKAKEVNHFLNNFNDYPSAEKLVKNNIISTESLWNT